MSAIKSKQPLPRFYLSAAPVLVVLAYGIWYWAQSHADLVDFYLKLNPAFYKAGQWNNSFFTEGVKSQGNWWCAAALAASVFLGWQLGSRRPVFVPSVKLSGSTRLPLALIVLTGTALIWKAWTQSHYSSDEVFSAIALAELPAFQTISYYPLPNNHLLFNLINGAFAVATGDLVYTGRLLSAAAFLSVLLLTFFFFEKLSGKRWSSLLFTLVIAVQFPVWGWSAQARGYEMMLFFGVISLLAGWRQLSQRNSGSSLLFSVTVALGMFTQPAFLFWWAGLFTGGLLICIGNKKALLNWLTANATAGALSLLLYLPLLTFSGLEALVSNPYVQPSAESTTAFLSQLQAQNYLSGLFKEWLPLPGSGWLAPLLLAVSLILLFRSGKRQGELACLVLGVFTTTLVMVIILRKAPFYRVFITHSWLFWISVLTVFSFLLKTRLRPFAFAVVIAYAFYSAFINRRLIPHHLYYYDVNAHFQKLEQCQLPDLRGKKVGLSDESFYWWALLKDRGPALSYGTRSLDAQDLIVIFENETFDPSSQGYRQLLRCNGFVFYEKVE
ncbi:MAG: hypothetical protein CMN32_16745 [Saprospirales bacterium]|nr:hypothetical protein [Saprospirales bacterium]